MKLSTIGDAQLLSQSPTRIPVITRDEVNATPYYEAEAASRESHEFRHRELRLDVHLGVRGAVSKDVLEDMRGDDGFRWHIEREMKGRLAHAIYGKVAEELRKAVNLCFQTGIAHDPAFNSGTSRHPVLEQLLAMQRSLHAATHEGIL